MWWMGAGFRYCAALLVLLACAGTPVLACLPTPTMSPAEMACCKKMAGDCHMGNSHHPCCETKVEHTALKFAEVTASPRLHPVITVAILEPFPKFVLLHASSNAQLTQGLPPPWPTASPSILRI